MPIVFRSQDFPVMEEQGARTTTLANQEMLGTNALQVESVLLQPAAKSASYPPNDGERFVYVIRGQGQAYVGQQTFPLSAESVLWLEKTDAFHLEAGSDWLEVLLCQAPATE